MTNYLTQNNLKTICMRSCLVIAILFAASCGSKESYQYPFQNPELSTEERVDDLVGRLTLEEKISQMVHNAPAIERLGIPEYNWWNECLHGVGRAGIATVFPQAIGLGAMWDEQMMFDLSTVISDEARAKHHNFASRNKRFIYQGLTFWSPNINIFRDPRWGRGQETYGEDPFLTGRLGVQFIKGLQGDDPKYFKTIATVKHFAVHSGPEPERHFFDAIAIERDFRETYFPQFEMGVKEGKAYSAMCAYNRLNGEACCGSNMLMNSVLRNEWGFPGYIVSDCDAIKDIYSDHKIVATPEEAAALAVKSGCDLNCGDVYMHLKESVAKNLITEAEIDVAVKRLFIARFKLGMFDPEEQVKYTKIPYDVVDSKKHRDIALEATRKSIVLLKNAPFKGASKNLLPLSKDIKTVAVIGPNSDQWHMLLGNYNGVPAEAITPLKGIKEKLPDANVIYAQGCELAEGMPMFYTIPEEVLFTDGKPGVKAEYFTNKERSGEPLFTSVEKILDANWFDKAPREDMDDDNFSVRWTAELRPDKTTQYQLGIITTCDTKLYLNDSLIAETVYHTFNEYGDPRLRKSNMISLEAGKNYKLRVEAAENYADAQVQLVWARPQPDLKKQAIEAARQADVVVMCMGLTARMEGEELDILIDGFRGGDRTNIDLPKPQQQLIKDIHALGKPIVLVLLNGSALAINWEDQNIPAIVEAWYPGQAAGTAIADVLFGDYNPAGRLPVTFYKSLKGFPALDDYKITTQTYRFYKDEVLYPFGYGLSYTTFTCGNLTLNDEYKVGDSVKVSVDVTNTGSVAGEEVVQVYISHKDAPVRVPLRSLKAFRRIGIKPGETQTVEFVLAPDAFSLINEQNQPEVRPGAFEVSVGGGQPGARGSNSITKNITLR